MVVFSLLGYAGRRPRLEEFSQRDGESSGSSKSSGESSGEASGSWFGAAGLISFTDAARAHELVVASAFARIALTGPLYLSLIGTSWNGSAIGVIRSTLFTSAVGATNFAHQTADCPGANFKQTPGAPQE